MSEKTLNNIRIVHKHDTEENWLKAVNFIPKQGELIIYDVDDKYNYERMKIGDGETLVNDLSFIDDSNPIIIVTRQEDDYTKATLSSYEIYDLRDEGKTLIFKDADMIYYLNYSEIDPISEATFISWRQEYLYVKKISGNGNITEERIEFAKASEVVTQIADVEAALYNAIVENDIEDKAYVDEKIAAIPKDAFKINITLTDNVYSADKTGVEIKAAIDAGNFVCAYFNNEIYYVTHCKDANIYFQYQKIALTGITSKLFACVIATDRWTYGEANIDLTTANLTTNHKSTIIGAINEVNSNKANQTDLDALENLVGTTSVQSQISSAIADLVDTAPETLDTLGELAAAIQENDSIIDTLDAAITNKADKTEVEALKSELDTHEEDSLKHIPTCSAQDNGKFLRVVNGAPTWVTVPNAEEARF